MNNADAIAAGDSSPLGATVCAGGANFSVFSKDAGRIRLHGILNAYREPLAFALPPGVDGRHWRRCIDTAQAPPDDIRPLEDAPMVTGSSIVAQPRSIVVLAQIVHQVLGARR